MDYKYKYNKYKKKYLDLCRSRSSSSSSNIKFPKHIIELSQSKKYNYSVDYSKFTITKSSLYSCEMPYHIDKWVDIIRELKVKNSCLDMTANIGSFSINMASNFKNLNITSIELDKCNYDALVKNIKAFDLTSSIAPIHGDSIEFIEKAPSYLFKTSKYSFIYLDPPWGGVDYKEKKEVNLTLSGLSINQILETIFSKNLTTRVFLKAPVNFHNNFKYKVKKYIFYKLDNSSISYVVYKVYNLYKG